MGVRGGRILMVRACDGGRWWWMALCEGKRRKRRRCSCMSRVEDARKQRVMALSREDGREVVREGVCWEESG